MIALIVLGAIALYLFTVAGAYAIVDPNVFDGRRNPPRELAAIFWPITLLGYIVFSGGYAAGEALKKQVQETLKKGKQK